MTDVRFVQLDVFPAHPGGGNPLGVVFGAGDWSAEDMQRFATWTRLVETTFVLSAHTREGSYQLRIFTPYKEIPFAGHPSIGSAYAVLQTGFARARDGQLLQECGAGLLPIRIEPPTLEAHADLFLRTPAAHILREGASARKALAPLLDGSTPGPLGAALVEGGRRWWVVELDSEKRLRNWRPDHAAVAELARSSDSMGLCVFARNHDGDDHNLVVRAYPAGANIREDPASGAANGLIAAFITQREPDGPLAHGYRVSQGREIGHDARLVTRVDDGHVWVGGSAQVIIDGRLTWSPATSASAVQKASPAVVAVG